MEYDILAAGNAYIVISKALPGNDESAWRIEASDLSWKNAQILRDGLRKIQAGTR